MELKQKFITKLSSLLKINLLRTSYKALGISLPVDFEQNGEKVFINKYLTELIGRTDDYMFFDVGQNQGDYSRILTERYPDSLVHGFEPSPELFTILEERFNANENIRLNNIGLGSKIETRILYTYKDKISGHGSLYREVFTDLHKDTSYNTKHVEINTIDNYCQKHQIEKIHFLKLDVEGHEFDVLRGASQMLKNIKVIQFEFNEMNILRRVFLKDFYSLLEGFDFYRITRKDLIPLGSYNSLNEIFVIQNLVAVNRKFV